MLNFKNIICVDKVLNEYVRGFMIDKVVYDFRGISDMDRLFEEINKIEVIKRLVKP
jgi:hypothetical protein